MGPRCTRSAVRSVQSVTAREVAFRMPPACLVCGHCAPSGDLHPDSRPAGLRSGLPWAAGSRHSFQLCIPAEWECCHAAEPFQAPQRSQQRLHMSTMITASIVSAMADGLLSVAAHWVLSGCHTIVFCACFSSQTGFLTTEA